jgi:DNA-binding GntR family transcriptional regulator
MGVRDRLWNETELYLRWSLDSDDPGYFADALSEHDAMVQAVLVRDANAVTKLITAHIQRTADALLAHLELDPANPGY